MTRYTEASSREAWLNARRVLLEKEKAHTKAGDELSRARRQLPWLRVEKVYTFDTPEGKQTLSELFAGKSQLIVYHFMFGPDTETPCRSCSFWSDHFAPAAAHLAARDVRLVAISRGPLPKLQAFARRMGWTHPWVSSAHSDFNYDFDVSFRVADVEAAQAQYNFEPTQSAMERHGVSVFAKDDAGAVFRTYSAYARGAEVMNGTYQMLDLAPKGRSEQDLEFTMSWVRFHDEYQD